MAPGTLSGIQKAKLDHIYHTFYDVNRDGVIDWDDFSLALQKVTELNKWEAEGEKAKQAKEALTLIWDGLKKYADANKDGSVTKEEWYKMWADCTEAVVNKQEFPFWLSSYMSFMFDAADTSGDNIIDKEEFTEAYAIFGLTKDDCESAFDKFTDKGQTTLTRENYSKLWHEFFLSDKADSKGNFLFGTVQFS